ncbi:MAPEG family protein [Roseovarius mucosus]|uniref:MAPEG family protein n=1 Tax=Roseovarius TaxID=74030 RepID=UPI001C5DA458|nr:MAPEG family protein [Roseovarius mucosus]MBW4972647.1 MAPEG family protein [Roseovarius mucosus]
MTLTITSLYAGLIGLLFVLLSVLVITARFKTNVSIGDGGKELLVRRIRVQANCAEYAPLGLILLALTEVQGAPGWVVHVLGLMLLLGRMLHAAGFGRTPEIMPMRSAGMVLTFAMLILSALANIGHALL